MGFALSPGVTVKEHDLSTTIPAVATSFGGMVGRFTTGPANERTVITSENELVALFGTPTNDTAASFFSAANFLKYGNNLTIVRTVANDALNAASDGTGIAIHNSDAFENGKAGFAAPCYAKNTGAIGNNVTVSWADDQAFASWAGNAYFDAVPDTDTNQEICVTVSNNGEVVETYTVSVTEGAKDEQGNNIFIDDVIATKSKYVYMIAANMPSATLIDEAPAAADTEDYSLSGGTDGAAAPTAGNWNIAWDLFANADEVDVNLLVAGAAAGETTEIASTVQRYVIQTVAEGRKDCVAFVSPPKTEIVGAASATQLSNLQEWRTATGGYTTNHMNVNSSYGFLDGNYKYQYDKYNDSYRWVPLAGDTAGLCVFTDVSKDPWWSPGGLNRGKIKGVVKLAFNPGQGYRDQMYKSPYGINPVVSMPGQGTVLWGDKTMLTKPSAFDRINVRRLFIVLEKAIATASKYMLFEFNDAFTRSQFRGMVTPFMKDVKGRRGMYDFMVVCDETNNTGEVIDRNEFVADIYIKPARSINFITLNFVATKTGVEFSELFGTSV